MATDTAVIDSEQYTGSSFDLQQYLSRSKQLDLTGVEWDEAADYPVEEGEVRCLQYMMDIEAHTLCYLRDVLNANAGADREIADFVACWLFEESYHGRAIEQFFRSRGEALSPAVCGQHRPSLTEHLENAGTFAFSRLFPEQFLTTYMAWGAIQEHTTLFGYTNLARRTQNPVLADILTRIARQESRHFGFYYYKAYQGLRDSRFTQKMVSAMLSRFWTPVGEGVKPARETDYLLLYIFADAEGRDAIDRIDRTMARLPGLGWFNLLHGRFEQAARRSS